MLLSWLFPGYGFFHFGLRRRGLLMFAVIELTFVAGVLFDGCVLWPDFNFRSQQFNLVAILAFLTQVFNGFLSLLSVLPEFFGRHLDILRADETRAWHDLGSFWLLVSGGMNYFVLVSTWDHFLGHKARGAAGAAAKELDR